MLHRDLMRDYEIQQNIPVLEINSGLRIIIQTAQNTP